MALMETTSAPMDVGVASATADAMKALTHGVRLQLLELVVQGRVSMPSEAAEILGQPFDAVRYHACELVKRGALQVDQVVRYGGAHWHHYAATELGERLVQFAYEWAGA